MVAPVDGRVPDPADLADPADRAAAERALAYMALEPGTPIAEIAGRPRLHRLVHERADRGPAHGGRDRRGPAGASVRARDGRPRARRPCAARRRRRASTPSSSGAGFEWRRAGCSMCLGMNPDVLAAGRALRVDLEPQLRGAPGTRRPDAPGQPGDGGRGGADRPTSRTSATRAGGGRVKAFRQTTGSVAVLDRADVDTDQIIPKQFLKRIERTGYGEFLFYDWRREPGVRAEPARVRGSDDPDRGPQLRLRLVARARGLGDPGLRLRGRRRAVVRRHLRLERRADRARHVTLPEKQVRELMEAAELTVDLEAQTITDPGGDARSRSTSTRSAGTRC